MDGPNPDGERTGEEGNYNGVPAIQTHNPGLATIRVTNSYVPARASPGRQPLRR